MNSASVPWLSFATRQKKYPGAYLIAVRVGTRALEEVLRFEFLPYLTTWFEPCGELSGGGNLTCCTCMLVGGFEESVDVPHPEDVALMNIRHPVDVVAMRCSFEASCAEIGLTETMVVLGEMISDGGAMCPS